MSACAKPYSAASDENKEPILAVIQPLFSQARRLLEIGSGTGQHAIYFSAAMPHLIWQASELPDQLPGLHAWLDEATRPNLPSPLALDVLGTWPGDSFDAVFSANTAHIMTVEAVAAMVRGVGAVLAPGGYFALYGPFNESGRYTSDSNRRFDAWLKSQDPRMGLRDLGDLQALADRHGLDFVRSEPMPVNNLTLIWCRRGCRVAD
ncbi:DUF938 domain-containing protein [Thioalkalicoccus limnaeus]|uniref:DUF938 domain-containing protein n=1 Tax=Thioalkalicoccus limnaeus TaxID=120681 RepID=A0ABV4BE06_9GAMM